MGGWVDSVMVNGDSDEVIGTMCWRLKWVVDELKGGWMRGSFKGMMVRRRIVAVYGGLVVPRKTQRIRGGGLQV